MSRLDNDLDDLFRENPVEDENLEDGGEKGKKEKEDQIAEVLSRVTSLSDNNAAIAKLAADPAIRQILDAHEKGESVTVIVGDVKEKPKEKELSDVELETLGNADFEKHLLGKITDVVGSMIDQKMESLKEKVGQVSSYVESTEKQAAEVEIKRLQVKYSDFEGLRPLMAQMSRQNPGLEIEEIYLLARRRQRGPVVEKVETERPSSTSARPPRKNRETPLAPGRKGFKQLLGEALDGLNTEGMD